MEQWPVPKNVKELRGFLGLTGYYRKFIKNYGLISRQLTDLLRKGVPQAALNQLKQALINALVLGILDFSKPFNLETYANDVRFGAVLIQDAHPVGYLSKAVSTKKQISVHL